MNSKNADKTGTADIAGTAGTAGIGGIHSMALQPPVTATSPAINCGAQEDARLIPSSGNKALKRISRLCSMAKRRARRQVQDDTHPPKYQRVSLLDSLVKQRMVLKSSKIDLIA